MNEIQKYLQALLANQGFDSPAKFENEFTEFASNEENIKNVNLIRELQRKMTKNWQIMARGLELKGQYITFPNGMMGKPYHAVFDFEAFNLTDITEYTLRGFENSGLNYDADTKTISGVPEASGDLILEFAYRFDGEDEEAPLNEKKLSIIINSDPKSLWKNIASDVNDQFYKPDNISETVTLGNKTFVVASKRGRSHANVGSFRDDDYAYAHLANGWSVIAISDGAGSAPASRKGSAIACNAVVSFFKEHFSGEIITAIDAAVAASDDTEIYNKVKKLALPYLSKAANHSFEEIEAFANKAGQPINAFHATLSYVLVKQYDKGYMVMTFGIGDCPMALLNKDMTEVRLMNKLDVGEFGGGTRFITMSEIFRADDFETRFNFEFVADFSYFVLMTDGIYDPKFEVEANLVKPERWNSFFNDLEGNNNENVIVGLAQKGEGIEERLSQWMDFWSPGNHDDRTLAILF
jgi:serine/threonine protein phosphatase PrpC